MDTEALKNSWELVIKNGDEVPLFFYSHLFLSNPELREMFPVSMAAQRDKLVSALGHIVSYVDHLDEVTAFVEQLGRDHRRFGVIAEHYHSVGASLLATLRHFLGPAWTDELAADWASAYGIIARIMVQAAEAAAASEPAWWEADIVAVERRTLDIAILQVKPREPYTFRPGQSLAVEVPQRPRRWRYYSPANAPREDGTLEFHVQLVDGGQVSTAIVQSSRVGDTVRIAAPIGEQLTREPGDTRDLFLVAGGTGLAPLRAVLEQIDREWLAQGSAPNVHLFHGARVPWNLYERERLTQLASRPWFTYTEVVSDDPTFPGPRGLVGTVAAQSGQWRGRVAMVCGSPQMVAHTVSELTKAGMPRQDIRAEDFAFEQRPTASGSRSGDDR
ncbi:globin domain-containing protein [Thermasporomyces composti]|jgi:NAD(P)H-flavin reductase/hemoglobin-like flavoprotein|uniref:nitric oxide dioxygenase n=1 Tax=Thermasporomyces composti TaxID=696763 RepID=A0A3D9V680_THECX|nr:globin domain-containing protein [Thermasporomyces composti]REF36989.1 NAD(P)H-flavin reductase [Thermasporomyces composti]